MQEHSPFENTDADATWEWCRLNQVPGIRYSHIKLLSILCEGNIFKLNTLSINQLLSAGLSAAQADKFKKIEQPFSHIVQGWLDKDSRHFVLPYTHPSYPQQLREITSPPLVLYGFGNSELLTQKQIAIVGSRNPSVSGKSSAFSLSQQLAQIGWVITSGLALGIDTQAHQGALTESNSTIAVLGTGIDIVYPRRNIELYRNIVACGGCIVSEMPFQTPPLPKNFPRRNRIISGLSEGVVVVEAQVKSGSLVTAKLGLEQNKEIFAVPGSINNPMSKGCHLLIKQGAKLVEQVADINEEFSFFEANQSQNVTKTMQKKSKQRLATDQLLASVGYEATSLDVVAQRSGLTITDVTVKLLEYELRGLVAPVPGGYIRLGE